MDKPDRLFDRTREWAGLASFAADPVAQASAGTTLGVVSGRRRQGKSFLLQALAEGVTGVAVDHPARAWPRGQR